MENTEIWKTGYEQGKKDAYTEILEERGIQGTIIGKVAYDKGNKDGQISLLEKVLKFVKSPKKEDYDFDLVDWLEQELKRLEK